MNTITDILTRRSVRAYQTQKNAVSKEKIDEILKAAMYAPSAMNKQPWAFFVVDDPALLAKIQEVHPYAGFLTEAGQAIIVCGDKAACYEDYWKVDPLLAGQNILLAAHALGFGTCWCGVYPNQARMRTFQKLLNLPEHIEPLALIALGLAKKEGTEPPQRFDAKKIHRNVW